MSIIPLLLLWRIHRLLTLALLVIHPLLLLWWSSIGTLLIRCLCAVLLRCLSGCAVGVLLLLRAVVALV